MTPTSTREGEKIGSRRAQLVKRLIIVFLLVAIAALLIHHFRKPPDTPLTRAVALIKSGKAAAALPILEQMARQHPDNPSVFPWLAQCYLRTDSIAEGRTALDTALRLKLSGDMLAPVVLAYANYYESKADFPEAERLYQTASAVCKPGDLAEGQGRLYLGWSDTDIAQGQLEKAVEHLKLANSVAEQLEEPLHSLIPHRLSEAYRQLAAVAETRGHDDATARQLLEESLRVSEEPATRMDLASICARQHDTEKAIENYHIVALADPNNLEARHRLIDLLLSKGDMAKAQEALTDLIDKEKSVENYQLLASCDLKLGNYPGAVRAFENAYDLRPKVELLKQLELVLLEWNQALLRDRKFDEAASVKGHADRVADEISELTKDHEDKNNKQDEENAAARADANAPPVALLSSRIWLAKGSLTPEGEIEIRNTTGTPITDLALNAVFYDNTARRATGSVSLPVAGPQSAPFPPDQSRKLYFSCPNIVKFDHQLAVIIFWKGRFLKEFPVVKQQ